MQTSAEERTPVQAQIFKINQIGAYSQKSHIGKEETTMRKSQLKQQTIDSCV